MANTVIGVGTHIESGIRSKDELHIEGRVDGPITGDSKVLLAASAQVSGDVSGTEVTIGCVLKHSVRASHSVRLLASAEVYGEVVTPRIVIDDGAVLEGQVKIARPQRKEEAKKDEPKKDEAKKDEPKKDERRKTDSPMRQIHEAPKARTIPELPVLGRRVAQRRK